MSTRRLVLFFGIALVAFLAFFLLASIGNTKGDQGGTRAPGDYQGADSCQGSSCHQNNYDDWSETNHARVFEPSWPFYNDWVADGRPGYCLPCHVVGYNKTAIGGFDPGQAWNSSYNVPLLAIQCENCHGPDPMSNSNRANTSALTDATVCGACHYGSRHPYYGEWNTSAHAKTPPVFVRNLACAKCHEAYLAGEYLETGEEPTALPANPRWQLTCATCHDPHSDDNEYQLRAPPQELCGKCHTAEGTEPEDGAVHHPMLEMRQGTANVPVPSSQTMSEVYCVQCHKLEYDYNSSFNPPRSSGHDFKQRPEACVICHDGSSGFEMNVNQAENAINFWQESTENNLNHARLQLDDAWVALNAANGYNFDVATKDLAWSYYMQANYSANFVEADGSMGAHNYAYANSLISFANLKAGQVTTMLMPGTVTGKVVDSDGNGVGGVQIRIGNTVVATTAADGSFTFKHAPGSFTLTLVKDGKDQGTALAFVIGGQKTDLAKISLGQGGAATTAASSDTMQLLNTLLIIIAIVLILVTMMVSRKKPTAASPKEPKPAQPTEDEKQ